MREAKIKIEELFRNNNFNNLHVFHFTSQILQWHVNLAFCYVLKVWI